MEVVSRADSGRCGVASKDLRQGESFLIEEATLFWRQGPEELRDIVKAYLDSEQDARQRIDNLTADVQVQSELLKGRVEQWTKTLESAKINDLTQDGANFDFLSLLLRTHFNAHEVPDGACLFPTAAMINHSCSPNSFYRCEQHTIQFFANRDIAKGEEITAAYLDAMSMLKPTRYRQEVLLESKGFLCGCQRCSSIDSDLTRAARCPEESCDGIVLPNNVRLDSTGRSSPASWSCKNCQTSLSDPQACAIEEVETELHKRWQERDKEISDGKTVTQERSNEAIRIASLRLHPSHFMVQFERILAIEMGIRPGQDRMRIISNAFVYAKWLQTTFAATVPSNLLGTMTGAVAELFDRKTSLIEKGLDIDGVLSIMKSVLPYAKIRYGEEAAYPKALEAVIQKYSTCSNLICTNRGKLSRCGRCDSASYCSRNCQIFHFKSQGHKTVCLEIVDRRNRIASLIEI